MIEDNMYSKIGFTCIKIQILRETAQDVPQCGDFEECSSGSRILRSQFFPGQSRCREKHKLYIL